MSTFTCSCAGRRRRGRVCAPRYRPEQQREHLQIVERTEPEAKPPGRGLVGREPGKRRDHRRCHLLQDHRRSGFARGREHLRPGRRRIFRPAGRGIFVET